MKLQWLLALKALHDRAPNDSGSVKRRRSWSVQGARAQTQASVPAAQTWFSHFPAVWPWSGTTSLGVSVSLSVSGQDIRTYLMKLLLG